jgi:hypothetical protein
VKLGVPDRAPCFINVLQWVLTGDFENTVAVTKGRTVSARPKVLEAHLLKSSYEACMFLNVEAHLGSFATQLQKTRDRAHTDLVPRGGSMTMVRMLTTLRFWRKRAKKHRKARAAEMAKFGIRKL